MFAYCINNPTGLIDCTGDCPHDGRHYSSGPFAGEFEYNPDCWKCAMHGEFWITSSSGISVDMTYWNLTNDEKVLVATIAAEAMVTAKGTTASWQARQAMANVAINRVGKREWKKYKTVADVCKYTGFDGYGSYNYNRCMTYLNNRDGSNAAYEALIWDVMQAFRYDITNGCQLYFTPAAMTNTSGMPNWNFSLLEEVFIAGVDSYYEGRFYKYK